MRSCGGITEALRCRICGADDDFRSLGRCRRCSLRIRLERLFDDGTGAVKPELGPSSTRWAPWRCHEAGCRGSLTRQTAERIRAIATGVVPLSHDGLDTLAMSNGREHLRALARRPWRAARARPLPRRLRALGQDRLASVEEPAERRLIAAYLRWHHGPRLSALADAGDLTESRYAVVRAQTNIAVRLLAWLRERETDLVTCTQADIDAWFAAGPTTRLHSRSFLNWAIRTHRRAALELPPDRPAVPRGIPEHQRLDLLGRFLADDDIDLVDRVAGCLVLLYALPLTRINRLRATDFESVDGGHALRIGDDLVPVPSALSALVRALVERPGHASSAGHPNSDWLFPGGRAGQPIEPDQLAERLNRHGVTRAARTAALDALLATVPAPVLAKLIDRRPWRVAQRTKLLGTDWRNYVALRVQS